MYSPGHCTCCMWGILSWMYHIMTQIKSNFTVLGYYRDITFDTGNKFPYQGVIVDFMTPYCVIEIVVKTRVVGKNVCAGQRFFLFHPLRISNGKALTHVTCNVL